MDIMVMGRRVAAVRASENSRVGGAPLGAKKEHGGRAGSRTSCQTSRPWPPSVEPS